MFVAGMISLVLFAVGRRRGSISTRAIQALAILMLCAAGMVGLASCGGGSSEEEEAPPQDAGRNVHHHFRSSGRRQLDSEQLTLVVQ